MANITMKNYNEIAEQWEELYPKTTADQVIDGEENRVLTRSKSSKLDELILMLEAFENNSKGGFVLTDDSLHIPFNKIPINQIVPKLFKCSIMSDIQDIKPKIGDYLLRVDTGVVYIYVVEDGNPSDINSWQSISSGAEGSSGVSSINGYKGDVTLNKSMVGLSNVENISKADYFVSPTFTGTVKSPTPAVESNDETVATTEFVKNAVQKANDSVLTLSIGFDEPSESNLGAFWLDMNNIDMADEPQYGDVDADLDVIFTVVE